MATSLAVLAKYLLFTIWSCVHLVLSRGLPCYNSFKSALVISSFSFGVSGCYLYSTKLFNFLHQFYLTQLFLPISLATLVILCGQIYVIKRSKLEYSPAARGYLVIATSFTTAWGFLMILKFTLGGDWVLIETGCVITIVENSHWSGLRHLMKKLTYQVLQTLIFSIEPFFFFHTLHDKTFNASRFLNFKKK